MSHADITVGVAVGAAVGTTVTGADVVGKLVVGARSAVVGPNVVGSDVIGAAVGEMVSSAAVGGSVLELAWHSHIASLVSVNS